MAKLQKFKTEEEVPEALKEYYIERDGEWVPEDMEGMVDGAKFSEFRENNRKLNARVKELSDQVARIGTLEEELEQAKESAKKAQDTGQSSALEEQIARLEKQLVSIEQTHKVEKEKLQAEEQAKERQLNNTLLERDLTEAGISAGVRSGAMKDFVNRGKEVFRYQEGRTFALGEDGESERYSKKSPSEKLSIGAWIEEDLMSTAGHLWPPSEGSGGGNGGNGNPRTINANDPLAFGQNLEDIASGKVSVQ